MMLRILFILKISNEISFSLPAFQSLYCFTLISATVPQLLFLWNSFPKFCLLLIYSTRTVFACLSFWKCFHPSIQNSHDYSIISVIILPLPCEGSYVITPPFSLSKFLLQLVNMIEVIQLLSLERRNHSWILGCWHFICYYWNITL